LFRWSVACLYVAVWSAALLTPYPADAARALEPDEAFLLAKALHVAAYAGMAVVFGWLRAPLPFRWLLPAFCVLHAGGTEYLQGFVHDRSGSWRDVGLDHLGILLGLLASRKWWRAAADPPPTPEPAPPRGGTDCQPRRGGVE
jgi:VanZ family protein